MKRKRVEDSVSIFEWFQGTHVWERVIGYCHYRDWQALKCVSKEMKVIAESFPAPPAHIDQRIWDWIDNETGARKEYVELWKHMIQSFAVGMPEHVNNINVDETIRNVSHSHLEVFRGRERNVTGVALGHFIVRMPQKKRIVKQTTSMPIDHPRTGHHCKMYIHFITIDENVYYYALTSEFLISTSQDQ